MHPYLHARTHPDKPACIVAATGEVITYRQLDERSNQGAHLFRSLGLRRGDVIAVCMENHPRFLEIAWANQRAGLYLVCISTKLALGEIEYILRDCGARLFVTSRQMIGLARQLMPLLEGRAVYMVGGASAPYTSWEQACAGMPTVPVEDQSAGADMLYSSGRSRRREIAGRGQTSERRPYRLENIVRPAEFELHLEVEGIAFVGDGQVFYGILHIAFFVRLFCVHLGFDGYLGAGRFGATAEGPGQLQRGANTIGEVAVIPAEDLLEKGESGGVVLTGEFQEAELSSGEEIGRGLSDNSRKLYFRIRFVLHLEVEVSEFAANAGIGGVKGERALELIDEGVAGT